MKYLNLALLTFFFFTASHSFSQNQDIARAYYIKAKEAFANEQYKAVIEYLGDAKKELGSTNPDIIFLELMSKYNIDKMDPKVGTLAMEFIKSADRGDDRIQNVSLIAVEHRKLIDEEIKREEKLYELAITSRSLSDLRRYIEFYPNNGERTNNVKVLIGQNDKEQFAQAKAKNTVKDLQQYKQDFPRGQHLAEAEQLLQVAREEELYAKAKKDDDIVQYQSYLKQYPNGKYRTEISTALKAAMITKANTEFQNENYGSAKISYENFMKQFPSGNQAIYASSQLNKIRNIEEKKVRVGNRTSKGYTMLTYSTAQEFGLEFGKLHLSNVATYFGISANKSVTNLTFAPDAEVDFIYEDFEEATLSANFGLTYKVGYPVWIYAGGGVKYTEYFIKDGSETISFEIEGQSPYQFFPEAGVQVKVTNSLVLKAGAMFLAEGVIFKAGIGF